MIAAPAITLVAPTNARGGQALPVATHGIGTAVMCRWTQKSGRRVATRWTVR